MELPALTPALKLLVPAEAVMISAPSAKVTSAAKFTAPSTSSTSKLVVPSTSMLPLMSREGATISPVKVAPDSSALSVLRFVKFASTSLLVKGLPLPARVTIVAIVFSEI